MNRFLIIIFLFLVYSIRGEYRFEFILKNCYEFNDMDILYYI